MSAHPIRGTLLGVAAMLAACGTTTTTSPAAGGPSSATASAPSSSSSASGSGGIAASLALTVDTLPANATAGAFVQSGDGLLNGQAGTDQRVFTNADHSWAIEVDVIVAGDSATAGAGYASVRDAAKARVTTLASSSSPNLGSQSDQFTGMTSKPASVVAITFVEGSEVAAVLVESISATVDPMYGLQVATAQDDKIKSG